MNCVNQLVQLRNVIIRESSLRNQMLQTSHVDSIELGNFKTTIMHWVPLPTSNLIHENLRIIRSTCFNRT